MKFTTLFALTILLPMLLSGQKIKSNDATDEKVKDDALLTLIDSMTTNGYFYYVTVDRFNRTRGFYFTSKRGLKEGPVYWFYSNGAIKAKGNYEKDVLDGVYSVYDYGGNEVLTYNFKGGLKEGRFSHKFNNGNPAFEGSMVKGKQNGSFSEYYLDGKLRASWSVKKGLKEGPAKWFYPNGNLYSTFEYRHGKIHGEYYEYDSSGVLITKCNYTDGHKIGQFHLYHPNQQIAVTCEYNRKGNIDGLYQEYFSDGTLLSEVLYKDGKKEGKFTRYYASGQPEMIGFYNKGRLEGTWLVYGENGGLKNGEHKIFYPTGELAVEGTCVNGKPNGLFESFTESGVISSKMKFRNGLPHDITQYYNRNGQPYLMEFYNNGEFLKKEKLAGFYETKGF